MTHIDHWRELVRAHHEQAERAQRSSAGAAEDFWEPFEAHFRADPQRRDDPLLDRLRKEVTAATTLLDVGGGAGRYALPLALQAEHVTVVEPSSSMVAWLRRSATDAGIENISVVQRAWEEAQVTPADVVLCANVVHGVKEIDRFIRKIEAHARRRVLVIEPAESPMALAGPLWEAVHGAPLAAGPALPELLPVLWELDVYPNVEMFEAAAPEAVRTWDEALLYLRAMLYVSPESDEDRRLQTAMRRLVVETPAGFTAQGARPRRLGLLSWSPALGQRIE